MSLTGSVYILFLRSLGLNQLQAQMVNFGFFTGMFLFEIPTGALADAWGRKRALVLSAVLATTASFLYFRAHTMAGCVVAELCFSIGVTLCNGTLDAWLTDRLTLEGKSKDKIRSTIHTGSVIRNLAGICAGMLGAYIATFGLNKPFFACGLVFALTGIISIFGLQEGKRKKVSLKRAVCLIPRGVHYAWQHQGVRFLMLLSIVQFMAIQAPNMQWQPFFQRHVPSLLWLGLLKTGITVSLLLGACLTPLLKKLHESSRLLVIIQIMTGLLVIGTVLAGSFELSVAAFLLHEILRGLFDPLYQSQLNDHIKNPRIRATVLSCGSLGKDLGGMIGLPLSGYLALHDAFTLSWTVSGMFMVVMTLLLARGIWYITKSDS